MKQLIKTTILLLAILLPALATAHDFKVDGIYYNRINSNEVEVTYGLNGYFRYRYVGTVTIPATVTCDGTTYSVTAIGGTAFWDSSGLTSIVIPNSVTSIGSSAFSDCTGLTSIDIPNSVTEIGGGAFQGCLSLTSVNIPNSVTMIGDEAFNNTAWYNNQPDGLVYAGMVAYKYKGTMPSGTNMTLKEGTLGIAVCAFEDCTGLTSIDIPNSVTSIGGYAFNNTAWYNNQLDGLVYAGMVAYKYKGTLPTGKNLTLREGTLGIAGYAFKDCTGLTGIVIPNSVTSIGDEAFYECTGLTSIDIPNSVTSIGYEAFKNCTGLTSVDIPNSVTSIGYGAFDGCTGLASIVISNSVTSIGYGAFFNCPGLTSIVVESGNPKYDSRNNCNAIIETASNTLFFGCKNTIIPNSVTSIGSEAFIGCSGLTSIVIPNSVTEIGNGAFIGCTGLTDVYCYIADLSRVSSGYGQFYLGDGDYSGRTLHVLQGTADAYLADLNWYPYFGQIVDDLIPETPSGDVNGDGEVSIADANSVINIIINGGGSGHDHSPSNSDIDWPNPADVNGDGEVNIADINAIIDMILSH